ELGAPDPYYILPILAALFTLANSLLMSYGNPNSNSNAMTFIMPAMIFFITFRVSSSLALYFATSNATRAIITLIFNNPFVKRRRLEEKEEEEREKERRRKRAINKARKTGRSVRK
ncbi:MAG TPA: YidC/Oxa1 family membrane protein insertase, partial [Atopostipes sp.]|nr:YidC/Oxa1 family membrane protein insertase [Atopostipes sp.]